MYVHIHILTCVCSSYTHYLYNILNIYISCRNTTKVPVQWMLLSVLIMRTRGSPVHVYRVLSKPHNALLCWVRHWCTHSTGFNITWRWRVADMLHAPIVVMVWYSAVTSECGSSTLGWGNCGTRKDGERGMKRDKGLGRKSNMSSWIAGVRGKKGKNDPEVPISGHWVR